MEQEDFEEVEDPSWQVLRELDDGNFRELFRPQLPDAFSFTQHQKQQAKDNSRCVCGSFKQMVPRR